MRRGIIALLVSLGTALMAQTTQGLIAGHVVDSLTGNPLVGAHVVAFSHGTNLSQTAVADASGFYVLPLLSPGAYQVRAEANGYQALQVEELDLPVAAALTLPFRLRQLSNVFEQKQYQSVFLANNSVVPFYGPDVDTSRTGNFQPTLGMRGMLDTSISYVIDPNQINTLPLAGRDVYALLVTLPGVTTDTATGRGLGLSVNGQRPSASNFLLDGLENNNYLITGPAITVAPEAVQEYRISTSNYSAEYGRTSGFLANAVTRTGGKQWHGLAYVNFQNEALDANDFQRNRAGLRRPSDKQWEPGISAGGPLRAPDLFGSASLGYQRFRGAGDPEDIKLPTRNFIPESDFARGLLEGFDAPIGPDPTRILTFSPPFSINQWFLLPRADYAIRDGKHRFMARAAVVRNSRPDFIWTPYKGYSSPLTQNTGSVMAGWLASGVHFTNEARAGWTQGDLRFDRAQSPVPVLASGDGTLLPGSPAFYGFRNRDRNFEMLENLLWVSGRHAFKAGGGALFRFIDGSLTAGRDGYYDFVSLNDFGANRPISTRVALSRLDFEKGIYRPPDYDRSYRQRETFFFAQDSFRPNGRLALNFGVRYENFGRPVNTGAVKDPVLALDSTLPLSEALRGATVQAGPQGDQPVYSSGGNWAVRLGGSWSLREDARTLLRAGYGTFYDRPFDNLWENLRNNGIVLSSALWNRPVVMPAASILPSLQGLSADLFFTKLYAFGPRLRAPRVQSYFAGLSHELTRSLIIEATAFNSNGDDLITTDLVNRSGGPVPNPSLPAILYRANEGSSSYHGLGISARYRTTRAQVHFAYTWSHSIDNQSEPLFGDFYDLLPTRAGAANAAPFPATFFFEQYNSRGDRGNSDFDQRHNLVAFAIWQLPEPPARSWAARWLGGWRVSVLGAVRSGFPYTVTNASLTQRLSLVNPALLSEPRTAVPGGVQLFDSDAFERPRPGTQGNTYRNQFAGPGLYSVDASLSRSWPLRAFGEYTRVSLRADAFNLLNHANLGNPGSALGDGFGVALFGRKENKPNFPALTPFNEAARQIQVLLRLEF